jgi:hypothetical protein
MQTLPKEDDIGYVIKSTFAKMTRVPKTLLEGAEPLTVRTSKVDGGEIVYRRQRLAGNYMQIVGTAGPFETVVLGRKG